MQPNLIMMYNFLIYYKCLIKFYYAKYYCTFSCSFSVSYVTLIKPLKYLDYDIFGRIH